MYNVDTDRKLTPLDLSKLEKELCSEGQANPFIHRKQHQAYLRNFQQVLLYENKHALFVTAQKLFLVIMK